MYAVVQRGDGDEQFREKLFSTKHALEQLTYHTAVMPRYVLEIFV